MLKTILKLCTINALDSLTLLQFCLKPNYILNHILPVIHKLCLHLFCRPLLFILSLSIPKVKNIKFINNKCWCIIYLPLICAQIVSFTRQIRRKPFCLQLKRANPRWISLLPSSLGIPSDHSVYKKLQTAVSSWVLLSYSHDTLATPVTSLSKQLHTHTSYCCGRVCV